MHQTKRTALALRDRLPAISRSSNQPAKFSSLNTYIANRHSSHCLHLRSRAENNVTRTSDEPNALIKASPTRNSHGKKVGMVNQPFLNQLSIEAVDYNSMSINNDLTM
jgi:hypothetical protein